MKMGMLKAILVDCIFPETTTEEAAFRMEEAERLVDTYGGIVLIKEYQKKQTPHYRTYMGTGKLEEIGQEAKIQEANIVIINNELKPQQVWNISEYFRKEKINVQVWDRIDLILKIFQKHASTKEAHLEIELASLKHMGPRIFGMGMELSRQGGGIGTRGIGETNIEIMRRHLKGHEQKIRKDLEKCKKERDLQRKARKRQRFSTVGIVGYTNAGKSTLLNTLTNKGAYVADALFATLDTRVSKLYLPTIQREVLLSDTIGFIQDLPHELIESFHSTLAETIHAEVLLHVIDGSDPRVAEKVHVVQEVLADLKADHIPRIMVVNKTDRMSFDTRVFLEQQGFLDAPVFISAVTKEGLDDLKARIATTLFPDVTPIVYDDFSTE